MARRVERQILYEALKKGQAKVVHSMKSGQYRTVSPEKSRQEPQEGSESVLKEQDEVVPWPPKLRALSNISGRVTISIPYPIVGILILTVILVVLLAFKLGQISGQKQQQTPVTAYEGLSVSSVPSQVADRAESGTKSSKSDEAEEKLLRPVGDHIILIAFYKDSEQLEPVKEHFSDHGIKTMIQKRGNNYFLITKDRYQSPKRVGTDGYFMKQKIRQVGATYVAPRGFVTFGARPFQDAYGEKIR